jgi:streptogramin lyase
VTREIRRVGPGGLLVCRKVLIASKFCVSTGQGKSRLPVIQGITGSHRNASVPGLERKNSIMNIKSAVASILLAALFFIRPASAQTHYDTNNVSVSTFAGYGFPGYIDGQGAFSAFATPSQIVADTSSNLYVWDNDNHRIRQITPDGTVSTYAGGGDYFEGYRTNVSLAWGSVSSLAIDHANRLWLVMANSYYSGNNYLLSIDPNGNVAIENGGLTNLTSYSAICFDSENRLYYSGGNRIYRYDPGSGQVQPFAGNGVAAYFDGQGPVFTAFNNPQAIACDPADNLYVWDQGNGRIRRIDPAQNVTTIAGSGYSYYSWADGVGTNASFYEINSLFFDPAGNLYCVGGNSVRRIDAQTNVTTLAGSSSSGFADGPGSEARFNQATGGCFSQGTIFIADSGNNRIRAITRDSSGEIVGPASLQLETYPGLQITGIIGRTYQIQSSPDLNTWTPVSKVLLTSKPYLWIDQNPVSGSKYYRAVMLP